MFDKDGNQRNLVNAQWLASGFVAQTELLTAETHGTDQWCTHCTWLLFSSIARCKYLMGWAGFNCTENAPC